LCDVHRCDASAGTPGKFLRDFQIILGPIACLRKLKIEHAPCRGAFQFIHSGELRALWQYFFDQHILHVVTNLHPIRDDNCCVA
jgi:hypothetical protein